MAKLTTAGFIFKRWAVDCIFWFTSLMSRELEAHGGKAVQMEEPRQQWRGRKAATLNGCKQLLDWLKWSSGDKAPSLSDLADWELPFLINRQPYRNCSFGVGSNSEWMYWLYKTSVLVTAGCVAIQWTTLEAALQHIDLSAIQNPQRENQPLRN